MKTLYCFLCLAAMAGMMGCERFAKPVSEGELRQACISRHLACAVIEDEGRWFASAERRTPSGYRDRWFGHGDSAEKAMGALIKRLDSKPDWPAITQDRQITTEPK